jgi:micrococcal nuclease
MVLAGLAAGSIFPAQDIPPPIPTPDLDQTTYPVIGIIDGHTVRVLIEGEEHKIVLCGVSTPATEAGRDQLQRFLEHLLRGESVFLEYEAAPGGDSPDRRSAHVFRAPDGLFVNLEIVRQGYGKVRQEATCAHLRVLRHYERRAKEIEKGVWAPPSQPERVSKAREAPSQPAGDAGDIIVYVTKSGTKYHRKDCYHLRKSSRPMTLREAVAKGYEPCSHCKPPTLQGP